MNKAFLALLALVLLFGCSSGPTQCDPSKQYNVTLPHSGEKVVLCKIEEKLGQYSRLVAEKKEADKYIKYEYSGGYSSGGGGAGSSISYSDSNIEYYVSYSNSGGGSRDYHGEAYTCIRGSCGFPVLFNGTRMTFSDNWTNVSIERTLCFSNGSYSKTTVQKPNKENAKETEISRDGGSGCPDN
jgi:hypothetical protein